MEHEIIANCSALGDNKMEFARVSGSMVSHNSHISSDFKGTVIEKTIRNVGGQTDHRDVGVYFECDPTSPGIAGLNTGISFNMNHSDKF